MVGSSERRPRVNGGAMSALARLAVRPNVKRAESDTQFRQLAAVAKELQKGSEEAVGVNSLIAGLISGVLADQLHGLSRQGASVSTEAEQDSVSATLLVDVDPAKLQGFSRDLGVLSPPFIDGPSDIAAVSLSAMVPTNTAPGTSVKVVYSSGSQLELQVSPRGEIESALSKVETGRPDKGVKEVELFSAGQEPWDSKAGITKSAWQSSATQSLAEWLNELTQRAIPEKGL